jgi:hypothetical protein
MVLLFLCKIKLLAKIRFYWRSSQIYWRKINFIGDFHKFIGENSLLLANWKLSTIFSNLQTKQKPSTHARFIFCYCLDLPIHA